MTTSDGPLFERLRRLPRPSLDDVAAARTLARAEAAYGAGGEAGAAVRSTRARLAGAWIPAALALWGALYAWGAVRELQRLFPAAPPQPAVAHDHRGPDGAETRTQFMLNAINRPSPISTPTMTSTVLRADAFGACSDVFSDMDPSMQVVACDTRNQDPRDSDPSQGSEPPATSDARRRGASLDANHAVRGGPRHDRGAAGGAMGARAVSAARSCAVGTSVATKRRVVVCGGSFQNVGRDPDSRAARSCSGVCGDDAIGVRSASPPSVAAGAAAAIAAAGSAGVAAAANAPKNDSRAMATRARKTRSL
jgi:hypothetical protein